MRLHRVMALATTVLLPVAAAACSMTVGGSDNAPIVIGADLELTGVMTNVGVTYQRALQLEVDNLNAQGGVGGHQVRLEIRDNRSDPTVSANNVSNFADDGQVAAVVMGACSECASGVAKIANDKKIPIVSLAPASQVASPVADRLYMFKLTPNADDSAAALANEFRPVNSKQIGVLTTDDLAGKDAAQAISAETLKIPGAQVKAKVAFRQSDTDLSQPVRSVLNQNVDTLVISAFSGQAVAAAKAARDQGFNGHIFFDATAAGDLFLSGPTATALEDTVMIAPQTMVISDVVATTPGDSTRKQWFNDYMSKYGGFSQYSTYAADAVQLIANAYNSVGQPDHSRMRDVMEVAEMDGISGPIRMTSGSHSGLMPQAMTALIVHNGRWRLLG